MNKNKSIEEYFKIVIDEGLYSTKDWLKFYLNYLFKNVSFKDKKMLDIGCGTGLFSFYAAYKGVGEVICIEPESEGSEFDSIGKFKKSRDLLHVRDIVKLDKNELTLFFNSTNLMEF